MTTTVVKKVFQSGGSIGIHLPKDFGLEAGQEVVIICNGNKVVIKKEKNLDNLESEPEFDTFIKALVEHSLKNPEELDDLSNVWNSEWNELLDGVDLEEDE